MNRRPPFKRQGAPFDLATRPPLDLIPAALHDQLAELDALDQRHRAAWSRGNALVTPEALEAARVRDRQARADAVRAGQDLPDPETGAEAALTVASDAAALEAQAARDAREQVRTDLADAMPTILDDPAHAKHAAALRCKAQTAIAKAREVVAAYIEQEAAVAWLHGPGDGYSPRDVQDGTMAGPIGLLLQDLADSLDT